MKRAWMLCPALVLCTCNDDYELVGCADVLVGETVTVRVVEGDDEPEPTGCVWSIGGAAAEVVSKDGDRITVRGVQTGGTSLSVRCDAGQASGCTVRVRETAADDLTGTWSGTYAITYASGDCADEQGTSYPVTLDFTHDLDDGTLLVGGMGAPGAGTGAGTVQWPTVLFEGSFSEDDGTTVSTNALTGSDPDTLTGVEEWTWTPGGNAAGCEGEADVVLNRD